MLVVQQSLPKHLCFQAACTLQMTTNRVRKSDGQQEALKRAREAAAETLRLRHAAEASSVAAPVDSGTDPPPAGRFRRSCCTPTAHPPHRCSRDGHCSCPRCSGRRDGDWWKSCHSTSTSLTRREATRTSSLPPDVCTDAHARTHILHPTALWRRLLRRLLPHRASPPRRPRSSLPHSAVGCKLRVRGVRIGAHIGRQRAAARARGFPAGGSGRRTVA